MSNYVSPEHEQYRRGKPYKDALMRELGIEPPRTKKRKKKGEPDLDYAMYLLGQVERRMERAKKREEKRNPKPED